MSATPEKKRAPWGRALPAALLLVAGWSAGAEFEFSGELAGQLRWFPDLPRFAGQFEHHQPSAAFEPEFRWYREKNDRIVFIPFARLDSQDEKRTHLDIRELFWSRRGRQWDVLIGLNRVFWGVTESRHLVNVINQVDGVEDLVEEDFLGQPMVNVFTPRDWGNISFYVLPGFRERTFAGVEGRPRFFLPVDTDNPVFESGAENHRVDVAVRYSNVFGAWDVGLSVFHGTGREPSFVPGPAGMSLRPFYSVITQAGADIQYTTGPWLWKFEGIVREGQGDTFGALVAGFEYTLYQIADGTSDLGVLLEYLYDDRNDNFLTTPPTIFENDLFFGARLTLNDIKGTALLAGGTLDLDNQSSVFSVEFERRINNSLSMEAVGRFFLNVEESDFLRNFENDSFLGFTLFWNF